MMQSIRTKMIILNDILYLIFLADIADDRLCSIVAGACITSIFTNKMIFISHDKDKNEVN
jgi:hypothetical protein